SETDSRNKIAESRSIYTQTKDKNKQIKQLEKLMKQAAEELDFMAAAKYRDEIIRLKENKN
ncbi:MAG: UvrB/UvrC motif-containing protein, partial [Bacteroidales bacterium]|nr:UvrB/UvrC motif-containing protein [Bacteroidales bacterium]